MAANWSGGFRNAVFGGRGKLPKETPAEEPRKAVEGMGSGPPEILGPASPGMGDRLPNGMALLTVTPTDDEKGFLLNGAFGDEQGRSLGGAGKPGLDLNSAAFELEETVTKLNQIASWSRELRQLVGWLNRARDEAEDELELVVWDETGFRIPWELFSLRDPAKRRPADFLGAIMTITRWLDIEKSDILQDYAREPGRASGPVAAYVYKGMERDKQLFRGLRVKFEENMRSLLESLFDASKEALAMVYAACHGEFSDTPGNTKLGSLSLESAQMVADRIGFNRLHNRQTLVFLNACASGPVGGDKRRYNDGALRGFPKMFLDAGAAGVLATAAPIEDDFAYGALGKLLERLQLEPHVPVAKAIRNLRRQASASLPADIWLYDDTATGQRAASDSLRDVYYWSLYLYYGSPRMTIEFAPHGDSTAGN